MRALIFQWASQLQGRDKKLPWSNFQSGCCLRFFWSRSMQLFLNCFHRSIFQGQFLHDYWFHTYLSVWLRSHPWFFRVLYAFLCSSFWGSTPRDRYIVIDCLLKIGQSSEFEECSSWQFEHLGVFDLFGQSLISCSSQQYPQDCLDLQFTLTCRNLWHLKHRIILLPCCFNRMGR